jgi:hypothetical protein
MIAHSRLAPVQRRIEELLQAARQAGPESPLNSAALEWLSPPAPPLAWPDPTSHVPRHDHPTGDQLFAYWEGRLDEASRAAIAAHANQCPACLRSLLEIGDLVLGG